MPIAHHTQSIIISRKREAKATPVRPSHGNTTAKVFRFVDRTKKKKKASMCRPLLASNSNKKPPPSSPLAHHVTKIIVVTNNRCQHKAAVKEPWHVPERRKRESVVNHVQTHFKKLPGNAASYKYLHTYDGKRHHPNKQGKGPHSPLESEKQIIHTYCI